MMTKIGSLYNFTPRTFIQWLRTRENDNHKAEAKDLGASLQIYMTMLYANRFTYQGPAGVTTTILSTRLAKKLPDAIFEQSYLDAYDKPLVIPIESRELLALTLRKLWKHAKVYTHLVHTAWSLGISETKLRAIYKKIKLCHNTIFSIPTETDLEEQFGQAIDEPLNIKVHLEELLPTHVKSCLLRAETFEVASFLFSEGASGLEEYIIKHFDPAFERARWNEFKNFLEADTVDSSSILSIEKRSASLISGNGLARVSDNKRSRKNQTTVEASHKASEEGPFSVLMQIPSMEGIPYLNAAALLSKLTAMPENQAENIEEPMRRLPIFYDEPPEVMPDEDSESFGPQILAPQARYPQLFFSSFPTPEVAFQTDEEKQNITFEPDFS